jgi:hypothetical protein
VWDWSKGYPESQWELLSRLENGKFLEDEKEISFYTTENERIGLTKNFLQEKTNTKAIYGAGGTVRIEKSLVDNGIFEITDRVGHYIKLRVEPMFNEIAPNEKNFKSVALDGQNLALLYLALSKGLFTRPKKGEIHYESNNAGGCTLYLDVAYYLSLKDSVTTAYYQGKFAQSNSETEWLNLMKAINCATTTEKNDIENLDLYGLYDE